MPCICLQPSWVNLIEDHILPLYVSYLLCTSRDLKFWLYFFLCKIVPGSVKLQQGASVNDKFSAIYNFLNCFRSGPFQHMNIVGFKPSCCMTDWVFAVVCNCSCSRLFAVVPSSLPFQMTLLSEIYAVFCCFFVSLTYRCFKFLQNVLWCVPGSLWCCSIILSKKSLMPSQNNWIYVKMKSHWGEFCSPNR